MLRGQGVSIPVITEVQDKKWELWTIGVKRVRPHAPNGTKGNKTCLRAAAGVTKDKRGPSPGRDDSSYQWRGIAPSSSSTRRTSGIDSSATRRGGVGSRREENSPEKGTDRAGETLLGEMTKATPVSAATCIRKEDKQQGWQGQNSTSAEDPSARPSDQAP